MAVARWLKRILDHYEIPYEERHHAPVFTASQLAHTEHISGHRVAKTVLLTDHGRPLAVVLPAAARLDLSRVQAVVGNPELRLATEEEVAGWFKGCAAGAVPPFRLRPEEGIMMDRSLAHLGSLLFAAGKPEDAVAVRFRDWYRAVRPGVGRFTVETQQDGHSTAMPRVLVVEDEMATNQLLCCLLEREGFCPCSAEAGNQALDMATKEHPAAILLDLMLPDMSGFEMYERLRRTGPMKRIPVIVVTALDDQQSRDRGQQLGADVYLTKPFRPDVLLHELQDVVADACA